MDRHVQTLARERETAVRKRVIIGWSGQSFVGFLSSLVASNELGEGVGKHKHTHTHKPKVSDIRSDPYNIHKNLEIITDLYVTRELK